MLARFRESRDLKRVGAALYAGVLEQARQPVFYSGWGVSDTVEGRFAMIAEHMAVVLARLGADGADGQKIAQALTEAFVTDMDDAMRKVGIGDVAVPRKVKRAAAALYDRHQAYVRLRQGQDAAAIDSWKTVLKAALATDGKSASFDVDRFAAYIDRTALGLARQPFEALKAGRIAFPQPTDQ